MNRPKIPSWQDYTALSPQATYALLELFDEYIYEIEKNREGE